MTNQHPITPPYELIEEWIEQFKGDHPIYIATQAAQWGADQELEACAKWVGSMFHGHKTWSDELRADRRPKPPSFKEQALKTLDGLTLPDDAFETIRFALEALDD